MITSGRLNIILQDNFHFELFQMDEELLLGVGKAALWSDSANLLDGTVAGLKSHGPTEVITDLGDAQQWRFEGEVGAPGSGSILQTLTIERYPVWPDALFLQWKFENHGPRPIKINRWDCPGLHLGDWVTQDRLGVRPWTFQGAAVKWGHDFAFPLPEHFDRENFLGHIDRGEGGGIPLAYTWTGKRGLTLAHVHPQPQEWYLPVRATKGGGIELGLQDRRCAMLYPGQVIHSLKTLVSLHPGDFFAPLALYREILSAQGLRPAVPNDEDYQPAWCSWGYEFDVRPEQVTGVLPVTRELGIRWLTLDDRWFDHYGDWNPRQDTFPGGEMEMREMVDEIHSQGAYAQIWWYPLAVEDGNETYGDHAFEVSQVLRQHPDWLILNVDGSVARNNRGLAILCPALQGVKETVSALTRRFIEEWDFDGHKLDNIYTVPACYNPKHRHGYPQQSLEALSEVYRLIFETTRAKKPYSVTQICPCGTTPTFSLLPYMDQAVTADPTSSAQIRQRIKAYKALLGPHAAVFADHVELSDQSIDFASEIGAGGVPATKFVWPEKSGLRRQLKEWWPLTREKQAIYRRWLEHYRAHCLSSGKYLDLYDLAFDLPEAHAIQKDGKLYYGFFTEKLGQMYRGRVSLRGLSERDYRLYDYIHDQWLTNVQGPEASLDVEFESSFLIVAIPVES